MNWEALIPVTSIIAAVASTGAALGWWLSGQFSEHRKFTYSIVKEMKDEVLKKLEYHEQHDDTRFDQMHDRFGRLRNDIWEIRLRNAAKDSYMKQIDTDIRKLKDEAEDKDPAEDSRPKSRTPSKS